MKSKVPVLRVAGVHTFYGHLEVLTGVSMELYSGEMVVLLGANGAGKTALLNTISGLRRAARGSVEFMGQPIQRLATEDIVRLGISLVPDNRALLAGFTVLDNLKMGAYVRSDQAEIRRDLDLVLTLFPVLAERRKQRAGTLSGGEQATLAIARALMAGAKLLLLDEPTSGVAPLVAAQQLDMIDQLRRKGITVLFAEQNVRVALKYADRGYIMSNGMIVTEGDRRILKDDDLVKRAYLGMTRAAQEAQGSAPGT